MKKIQILTIAFILLIGISACKRAEDEIEDPQDEIIEETTIDLVLDGKTDYVIVYPEQSDEMIRQHAVTELTTFFQQATGIELDAKSDKNLTYSEDQKYLSIGKTSLLASSGIDVSQSLGESGLKVVTKGQSVFMFGDTRFGTLYSVYEFLEHQFDFEVFAVDEIYINQGVDNLKLLDFNVTDIPTFQYRLGSYGELWYGSTFTRRMRMQTNNDIWISLGGLTYHNFFATVPPAQYKEEHPEWYSADGRQLCLMTDPEGLKEVVVNQMKTYISNNPQANNVTFTQEDYNLWCENETSRELKAKYGTNAAEMIIFLNLVAEEIDAWLKVEDPDRDVKLVMFAYHKTEDAPARYDEATKSYVPIDDDVVLNDNVAVIYAPIFSAHYYDYYHEENINTADTLRKWSALTDNIYLWSYGTYFLNYLAPYDIFNSVQGKYKFAEEMGTQYMFDQGQYNQSIGTDWFRLKQYIIAELQWDVDQDMNTLVDKFFTNYFKDASEDMKSYYDSYRAWYAYIAAEKGVNGYVTETNMISRELYPRNVLMEWMGHIENAYESIKHLENTDPILYRQLSDRITLESISVRYLLVELYEIYYSETEYILMVEQLKLDATKLGVVLFNEFNTVDSYFNKD